MHMQGGNDLKLELRGESTGGHGPDLTGYPTLTHAPSQWGEGVRVASNGAGVFSVSCDVRSLDAMILLDAVAQSKGITLDELFDCLRYDRAS